MNDSKMERPRLRRFDPGAPGRSDGFSGVDGIHDAIKSWMKSREISSSDLALLAGTCRETVNLVLMGKMRSPRVFEVLREVGCPPELLEMEKSR